MSVTHFALCFFTTFCLLSSTKADTSAREKRADDQQPLQAVVDGLVRQMDEVNAQLASMRDMYTELQNKFNAAQRNVAFYAYHRGDPFNVASQGTVVFDTASTNIGNGYDPQTGYFTVPVSGTYAFFINCMAVEGRSEEPSIMLGDTVVASCYSWKPTHGDTHEQGASLGVVHVTSGQRLRVRLLENAENVRGGHWNTFAGFLIRADP